MFIILYGAIDNLLSENIVANHPGTSGTVPDLKALSRIPKFTWIVPDFQGSSNKSGLSSFIEGHLALASVEQ